jgi:hypothetical protein
MLYSARRKDGLRCCRLALRNVTTPKKWRRVPDYFIMVLSNKAIVGDFIMDLVFFIDIN